MQRKRAASALASAGGLNVRSVGRSGRFFEGVFSPCATVMTIEMNGRRLWYASSEYCVHISIRLRYSHSRFGSRLSGVIELSPADMCRCCRRRDLSFSHLVWNFDGIFHTHNSSLSRLECAIGWMVVMQYFCQFWVIVFFPRRHPFSIHPILWFSLVVDIIWLFISTGGCGSVRLHRLWSLYHSAHRSSLMDLHISVLGRFDTASNRHIYARERFHILKQFEFRCRLSVF